MLYCQQRKVSISMRDKKKSLLASRIMTAGLFVLILALSIALPYILKEYQAISGREDLMLLCWPLYLSALPGFCCTGLLWRLLGNIRRGEVFISRNVTYLRLLSWGCFFVGAEYTAFGFLFTSLWPPAFAAFFFGLILRVIKNVFDAAILLREENDFTI